MKFSRLIALFFSACACLPSMAFSSIYYIANTSGADSSDSAIAALNILMPSIKPGDNILFRRGDVFRGEINIPSVVTGAKDNPIVLGSYGSGAKPVISGSVAISHWTNYSGNIWSASVIADSITQVFEGSRRLTLARAPNSGYFRITSANGKKGFTDAHLAAAENYWKDATIVFRLNEWLMEKVVVQSSGSDGSVRFSLAPDTAFNDIYAGSGYFVQNKFELLDSLGEWFFDAATKTLYVFRTQDPSSADIRASVFADGIKTNWPWTSSYITIQDLEFREHAYDELSLYGSDGFIVEGCVMRNAGHFGMRLNSDFVDFIRNAAVRNNTIENSQTAGIVAWNVSKSVISGNTVRKSGICPCYGGILNFTGTGISLLSGDSLEITHNIVDSSGNCGIAIEADSSLVEKNRVSYSMLVYSDGGALYNNNGRCNVYRNNVFKFTKGDMEPCYPGASRFTKELYLDAGEHRGNIIENNTMYSDSDNAGIGLTPNTASMTIRGNVIYKCRRGLEIMNYDPMNKPVSGLDARRNVFFTNLPGAHPYWINAWNGLTGMFQTCDSNYLFNPFSDKVAQHMDGSNTEYLDFTQWKSQSGADAHSTAGLAMWTYLQDSSFILINETDSTRCYSFDVQVRDLDDSVLTSVTLAPFTSKILIGRPAVIDSAVGTRRPALHPAAGAITMTYNPSTEVLLVTSTGALIAKRELKIFGASGRLVYSATLQSRSTAIGLSRFGTGVYFVKIDRFLKKITVQSARSQSR